MAQLIEVKVPELGEGIESSQISSIMVKVGEQVQKEQALLEVESDKASIEIPAPNDGIVKEIYVKNGESIRIGQLILSLESLGPLKAEEAKEGKTKPQEENHDSLSTETISKTEAMPTQNKSESPAGSPASHETLSGREEDRKPGPSIPLPAAPSVRRLARELGADIRSILGSGGQGRISIEDVKNYVKRLLTGSSPLSAASGRAQVPALPNFSQFGPIRREKMQGLRQKISQKMELSSQTIPHVTQFDEAEITALENFRQRKNKELQKKGLKITVTSLAIKVLALALRKFPKFNASIDSAHEEIIYKDYVHIGIAVDTPQGLIVPVLRDADQKGLLEITEELSKLAQKAREKKIQPGELQGSCLSLTNLGGLGTSHFTPIINWPEVAVLGLGRAKSQLSMRAAGLQQQLLLPLSLSYDHRLIDGAEAARFLRWIAENLEYPSTLL